MLTVIPNDSNDIPFSEYFHKNYEELSKNDWELYKKLIKEGVNPNELAKIIRNDEIEKLQEISSQNDFDFIQTIEPSLYERCSFINEENVTLIDYAAFFGSVKCFKFLLMNEANINNTGKYAVEGGNLEIIHLCEQNHSTFEGAFEAAVKFHRNDVFKYIYENKIVEYSFEKVVDLVLFPTNVCINIKILLFFLENIEIDVNYKNRYGKTALIYACEQGYIELVKLFLEQEGIDINVQDKRGDTALMKASKSDYLEVVELLLEKVSIDINAQDYWGNTALMFASEKGYTNITNLLIEQGNINTKNIYEKTALILASENGQIEIVKLLLEQEGIDINAKDRGGSTALIEASKNGNTEIAKLLLEQEGIDINAKDDLERTSLMHASLNDNIEIVKLLLEQEGIDVNAKDEDGRTAYTLACTFHHEEIVKIWESPYYSLLRGKIFLIKSEMNKQCL